MMYGEPGPNICGKHVKKCTRSLDKGIQRPAQSLAIENDFHSFAIFGGGVALAVERLMTAPNSRHAHGYLCGHSYGYGYEYEYGYG